MLVALAVADQPLVVEEAEAEGAYHPSAVMELLLVEA